MLDIADLRVNYGQIEALKGISLTVSKREIIAILGANGAGKTTLMRTISGLLLPRSGTIHFDGVGITKLGADRIVRRGIAQSPEGRRVFGTLTVLENLRLGGFTRPHGEIAGSLDFVMSMFPRLAERRGQFAGTLSGGEQQMLAIGRALMAKPRLLLLDEPSLGLAPIIVQAIFRSLRQIARTGVTVLLVEQNARMALKLADRGYVLEVGRIVLTGEADTLLGSSEIQTAYLGGERSDGASLLS
ncbi:ABC transporter ATP-binding protein [Acidiphilium sp. AL]|uniref:ABC transporter ATP-binding protein n=1 Tax=Acidiphilium TaxID=522 RepID=UPI0022A6D8F4|nr:ABC transporter ATP-binding protein [Acidiphilium iwatense]MCU4161764.1 ABC transporter ATP-binding protein [Acidiphilium sp. AL]